LDGIALSSSGLLLPLVPTQDWISRVNSRGQLQQLQHLVEDPRILPLERIDQFRQHRRQRRIFRRDRRHDDSPQAHQTGHDLLLDTGRKQLGRPAQNGSDRRGRFEPDIPLDEWEALREEVEGVLDILRRQLGESTISTVLVKKEANLCVL
jgi:hypothetical protein